MENFDFKVLNWDPGKMNNFNKFEIKSRIRWIVLFSGFTINSWCLKFHNAYHVAKHDSNNMIMTSALTVGSYAHVYQS